MGEREARQDFFAPKKSLRFRWSGLSGHIPVLYPTPDTVHPHTECPRTIPDLREGVILRKNYFCWKIKLLVVLHICIVRKFFINPRPACCEIEEGGEGERDTCKIVEVYCPARIACGNPFHLLARQVEGGTRRGPPSPTLSPIHHFNSKRPQRWIFRTASDLEVVNIKTDIGQWWWSLFVFTIFLIGRLWADIWTVIVWRKLVNFRRTPIFCRRKSFWHYQHGRPVQQAGTVRERVRP